MKLCVRNKMAVFKGTVEMIQNGHDECDYYGGLHPHYDGPRDLHAHACTTRTTIPHHTKHIHPNGYTQSPNTISLYKYISLSLSIYLPHYLLMVKCIPLRISNKILVKSIKKSMALKNPYHTYKPHFIKRYKPNLPKTLAHFTKYILLVKTLF